MHKALIIDDVEKARAALKADLQDYCPEIEIIGEADGVGSGLEAIEKLKPDVIFLDIQMDDGTGFDLLSRLNDPSVKVIFSTAYDQYAIKAFKFSAIDYLLKPVDPDELVSAVKKLNEEEKNATADLNQSYQLLLENLKMAQGSKMKKIALNTQEKVHVVNIDEIINCESSSNYTIFYLTNNRQILVTKTLKEFEAMLADYNFIRVHHSQLINMDHLKEYVKSDGGYALMTEDRQVPVSTRKKDVLMKKLAEL